MERKKVLAFSLAKYIIINNHDPTIDGNYIAQAMCSENIPDKHSARATHVLNNPLVCSIGCLCSRWLFRFSVLHSNKTVTCNTISY